jgi:TATA-binding protein-associated factor Taf7
MLGLHCTALKHTYERGEFQASLQTQNPRTILELSVQVIINSGGGGDEEEEEEEEEEEQEEQEEEERRSRRRWRRRSRGSAHMGWGGVY